MASLALGKLTEELDLFDCDEVGPDGVLGSIVDCIEGEAGGDGAGPMATVLRALAEKGFAPVSSDSNAQAQALSLANVGGLVRASSKVMGLPSSVRSGANFGVVPSSQYTRNLIARPFSSTRWDRRSKRYESLQLFLYLFSLQYPTLSSLP